MTEQLAVQRVSDAVVGYRVFRAAGRRLVAVTCADEWTAELQEATCVAGHPAPAVGCHCGLHAFSDLATCKRWRAHRTVIGAVRFHGSQDRPIIAGELPLSFSGWAGGSVQIRAPFGELVALLDDSRRARRVAKALGVPALPERDGAGRPAFERFAREHGVELKVPGGSSALAVARPQMKAWRPLRPAATRTRWVAPQWPSPWLLVWPVAVAAVTMGWLYLTGWRVWWEMGIYAYVYSSFVVGWRVLRNRPALNVYGLVYKLVGAALIGVFATPVALFPGPYVWPVTARLLALVLPPLWRLLTWGVRSLAGMAWRAVTWAVARVGRGLVAGHLSVRDRVAAWRTAR